MSSDRRQVSWQTLAVFNWWLAAAIIVFAALPVPLTLVALLATPDGHWSLGDTVRLAHVAAVIACVPVLGRSEWKAATAILAIAGSAALVGIHQTFDESFIAGQIDRGLVEALVASVYIVLVLICLYRSHLTEKGEVRDPTELVKLAVLLLNVPLALVAISPMGWWLFLVSAADFGSGEVSGDAAYSIVVLTPIAVVWLVLRDLQTEAAVASVIQGVAWLPAGWDAARGRFTEYALILCFLSLLAAISLLGVGSRQDPRVYP